MVVQLRPTILEGITFIFLPSNSSFLEPFAFCLYQLAGACGAQGRALSQPSVLGFGKDIWM